MDADNGLVRAWGGGEEDRSRLEEVNRGGGGGRRTCVTLSRIKINKKNLEMQHKELSNMKHTEKNNFKK